MFSSESLSRDVTRSSSSFLLSNPGNQTANFKHVPMEASDFFPNGLARFRSAPSSFLAALLDSNTDNSSVDESEAMFSALFSGAHNRDLNQKNDNSGGDQMQQYHMKQEVGVEETEPRRPASGNGHMRYETAVSGGGGAIVGSYSVGMESQVHAGMRNGGGNNGSNLARQSSSPAGFLNGFGVMGEVGNYTVHSHAKANASANGMSSRINFSSSVPSSSSRFMPSIPENGQLRSGSNNANGREFEGVFPRDSWNDSHFNNTLKRNHNGDLKMASNFSGLENQSGESRKSSSGLVHHLSLPNKSSAAMAEVEKFLQFQQDTVPCQVRAKRGCATHPRSIAERVRRTRISEKMKKLQDLFPNMDKQTSTADMLDMAVEYIKDLQKQVHTLADRKAKCVCSSKPQQTTPTTQIN